MSSLAHRCGKCPATWVGANICHCRPCHRTFTGITAFDAHRVGPINDRRCDVSKLAQNGRGTWGRAEADPRFLGDLE